MQTVDDAVEVLTGMPAGDPALPSDETVNGRIARRLREYAQLRRGEPRGPRRRGAQVVVRQAGGERNSR